eukprot:6193894-Pleurochrysis_carterae.AAC.3
MNTFLAHPATPFIIIPRFPFPLPFLPARVQPGFRVDFEQIALGKATTLPSAVADFCEKNSCDLLFLASAKAEGAKGGPSLEPEILSLVRTGCAHMMVVKPFAR